MTKEIKPSFMYAPKQRTLHMLAQNNTQHKVPAIAVYITSLAGAPTRRHNKNTMSTHNGANLHDDYVRGVHAPNPVNITISMSLIARYQRDMEQMLTNFIPYNDPYIILSMRHPITEEELQLKCKWNDDVSFDYPTDQETNSPVRLTADCSFTIEGWLFKANNPLVGKIHKIDTTYTAVDTFTCLYDDMFEMQSEDSTDYFRIIGRPLVRAANTTCIAAGSATTVTLYGQMFKEVTGVYLSAGEGVTMPDHTAQEWNLWDAATSDASMISAASSFDAYALEQFAVSYQDSDIWGQIKYVDWPQDSQTMTDDEYHKPLTQPWTKITTTIPALSGQGMVDVIVTTPAGVGLLSLDSRTIQTNPYPEDHPMRDLWVPIDEPWAGVGLTVTSP